MKKREIYEKIINNMQNLFDFEITILTYILDKGPCSIEILISETKNSFSITKRDFNLVLEQLKKKNLIIQDKSNNYNINIEVIGALGYNIDCKNGIE